MKNTLLSIMKKVGNIFVRITVYALNMLNKRLQNTTGQNQTIIHDPIENHDFVIVEPEPNLQPSPLPKKEWLTHYPDHIKSPHTIPHLRKIPPGTPLITWKLFENGIVRDEYPEPTGSYPPIIIEDIWKNFKTEIEHANNKFEVPIELIIATIATESSGNRRAVRREPGYVSDYMTPERISTGLMQTLLSTAREMVGREIISEWLLVPGNSIDAGTAYIKAQYPTTHFDPPLVAAAYNAGGLYYDSSVANPWKLRCYPIGTGKHIDRFVSWFNLTVQILWL